MDLRTHRNALILIKHLFDRKVSTVPCIETSTQKPPFGYTEEIVQPFPRSSPEAQGISSEYIAKYLTALNRDKTLDMHHIMILRNGYVIAEGSFGAYDIKTWHITHSECKSITGLAIGMLIDEGKLNLDDKVVKIFDKSIPKMALLTHKNMTIRHLLTMTSGIVFNETGSVTETDWVKCFFESAQKHEPGKYFNYNSMNTYILSAIVKQISGQNLTDYLRPRLWEPLGITRIFWETCPKGIEKGGWGLYIRPEDIAKIGQLFLQKGNWKGRQLISEAWIRESTTEREKAPEYFGDYNYAYQIWTGRGVNSFLFNGMFGQNVLGFPDTNMLIVSNAGNNEFFQQSNFYRLTNRYFSGNFRPGKILHESRGAYKLLRETLRSLGQEVRPKNKYASAVREFCHKMNGRTYTAEPEEAVAVGVLPLFAQAIQNNYTQGLKNISFSLSGKDFFLTISETDEKFRLPLGFDTARYTVLSFHGEAQKVGVFAKLTTDEDDTTVLKVRISFLEIANTRIFKIFFHPGKVIIKCSENPGRPYLDDAWDRLKTEVKTGALVDAMIAKADSDFIKYKIRNALEPEITAYLRQ